MLMVSSPPRSCESAALDLISALAQVSYLSASTIDDSEILSSVTESLAEVSTFPRHQWFRLLFIPLSSEHRKDLGSLSNSASIGVTLIRSIGNSLGHFRRYQNELLSYKRGKPNEKAQQNVARALEDLYDITRNLVQIQGYRCYIQPILDTTLIQSMRRGLPESQMDFVQILSLTDNLDPSCFSPVLLTFCQSLCRQIESSASLSGPAVPYTVLLAIFTNLIRLPQIRNYYWSLTIAQNKNCYRRLIQLLADPDLCVVIYSMRILALLVWDRPNEGKEIVPDGIGEKLFTSDNISQTVKLAFHLISCHASIHTVQNAVDLLDVLLKREWIRDWVEGYQHLKSFLQSLAKKLCGMLMSSDTSMSLVIQMIRLFTLFNTRNIGRTILLNLYAKYNLTPLILGLLAADRSFMEWKEWVLHPEDKVNETRIELDGVNKRHKASLRNIEPDQFDTFKDIFQWVCSLCSLQNSTHCEMTPPPTPSSIEHESGFHSKLSSNTSHASATSTSITTIPASDLDLIISTLATLTHSIVSTPLFDLDFKQMDCSLSEEWLRRINAAIDCLLQLLDNEKQTESHRDEWNILRTLANFLRVDVLGDFVCRQLDCFICSPDEETGIGVVEQERVQLIQVCVGVTALISRIVQSGILQSGDTQVAFTQAYLTQGEDMESNVQGSLIKIYSHSRFPHLLTSCLCGYKITSPVIISSVLQLLSDISSISSLAQEENCREPWSMDKITKNMGILLGSMNQRYLRMKVYESKTEEHDNKGQPGEWTSEEQNQDHLIPGLSHMAINDKQSTSTKSLNHLNLTFGKNTTKSFVSSTIGLLRSVQDQVVQYSREVEKEMDVRERELMEEVGKWKDAVEKAKEAGEGHYKQVRLLEKEKESLIKEHSLQLKDVMAATQRQIKDKNDEITEIRSELAESIKQVEELTLENGRMKSTVEDLEKRMAEMKLSYETMLANEKKEWALREEALNHENEERKRKEIELQGEVARLDEYSETLEAELENHMQFMSRLKESASKVKRRRPGKKEGD